MDRNIKIVVLGAPASGKSTIEEMIFRTLRDNGAKDIAIIPSNPHDRHYPPLTEERFQQNVKAVMEGLHAQIIDVPVHRDGSIGTGLVERLNSLPSPSQTGSSESSDGGRDPVGGK